jgi:Zn-dependent metalloprotease
MKKNYRLLLVAVLCLCADFLQAQNVDTTGLQRNENGKISFAHVLSNTKMADAKNFLKNALHTTTADSFGLEKQTTDELGIIHQRYQQYYKGIKVENAEYMLHGKNGVIKTMNGDFQIANIPSVIPALSEEQALSDALNYVNAKEYKWEDSASEKYIKLITGNPNATYYPKGELVIERDYLKGGKNLLLSWKFSISSLNPNNKQLIFVNANTGAIINKTPQILDVNSPLTAQTKYSGTLGITGDSYSGVYRLREVRNGVNVETLNLNGTYNYSSATDFTNGNTNWISGSWPTITQDQQALDAHWGAEKVLDFWRTIFNRNSLDDNGLSIMSYVHNPVGGDAYWDGTAMNYGDGNSNFNPLTALDVCAHEFGHGICQYTANLAYVAAESSALNEGFSDIWGACVENWAAPTKQTWLIGEDITKVSPYYIRSLSNPKSGMIGEGTVDTYHGTNWSYSSDASTYAHENMSVLTHWFYLLSQGGANTNDLGNGYSVLGIGITKAEAIAWRTESVYLTSSADYATARTASIQAATDLYCANSPEVMAVTNAWYAVGVGAVYNSLNAMKISGPSYICTSGSYNVINEPTGITSTLWSTSNTSVATINGSGAASKVSNGSVYIYANMTGSSGCSTTLSTVSIPVGITRATLNASATPSCNGTYQTWNLSAVPSNFGTNWNWTVGYLGTNSQIYILSPNSSTTNVDVSGGGTVNLTYTDACGNNLSDGVTIYSSCHSGYTATNFTVAPNPVQNDMTVTALTNSNLTNAKTKNVSSSNLIYGIKITDVLGILRKSFEYKTGIQSIKISVTDLNPGIYSLSVFDGQQWQSQNVIVQK